MRTSHIVLSFCLGEELESGQLADVLADAGLSADEYNVPEVHDFAADFGADHLGAVFSFRGSVARWADGKREPRTKRPTGRRDEEAEETEHGPAVFYDITSPHGAKKLQQNCGTGPAVQQVGAGCARSAGEQCREVGQICVVVVPFGPRSHVLLPAVGRLAIRGISRSWP